MRINGRERAVQLKHALKGRDGDVIYELVGRMSRIACRRVTTLRGGGRISIVLPVDTLGALRLFLDADDEASGHRHSLREMLLQAAFAGVPEDTCERDKPASAGTDVTRQLQSPVPDDEFAIHTYLKALVASIGMDGYVAFLGDFGARLGPCLNLLVGCAPGWVQRYVQHRWYLSDALLRRAVESGRPVMGSEIERNDDTARSIARNSARHAIFAAACFPSAVNAPGIHARFGCVVFVSSLNAVQVEPPIRQRAAFLRGAVSTAIDAWVDALKGDAARRARLSDTELAVLIRWRDGESATQSARALDATESSINYHRRAIKSKLGAASLRDAYVMATDLGLLHG